MEKVPRLDLLVQFFIHDAKTGKLIRKTKPRRSHSFVIAWLKSLEAIMAHAWNAAPDAVTTKDTGNTDRAQASYAANQYFACEAPVGTSTYGIQVGTGTTAPTSNDYTVETQIAHGVGAGQLQYGACGVQAAGVSGANVDMVITRTFTNGSGGSITVRECTIVIYTNTWQFLIVRDAANQAVANGQVLTVQYTFRTTV